MKKFWLNQAKTVLSLGTKIDWLIDWLCLDDDDEDIMILDVEKKKKETITGFLSFGFITDKLSFNSLIRWKESWL